MTNPLEGFTAAIEVFRRIDPTFSGPVLATFLQVATNPGLSVQEVADRLNMAQSSASKNVFVLSKYKTPGIPGLDLIRTEINEFNRRQKQIYLTPKGERVLESIRRALTGAERGTSLIGGNQ